MKNKLAFLIYCSAIAARQLPLPPSLSLNATYYYYAKQLKRFSCGYNVLFNALNFEQSCGFQNAFYRYTDFEKAITPYIIQKGLAPKKTSFNKDTESLASILELKKFLPSTSRSKNLAHCAIVYRESFCFVSKRHIK